MSFSIGHLYEFGPFRLEPAERRLLRDDQQVSLPPKAFEVLVVLVSRAGHLVSKEELLKEVWPDTFVEEASLSYTVSLLRKALQAGPDDVRYIDTVQKLGYRFTYPVRIMTADGSRPDIAVLPPASSLSEQEAHTIPALPALHDPPGLRIQSRLVAKRGPDRLSLVSSGRDLALRQGRPDSQGGAIAPAEGRRRRRRLNPKRRSCAEDLRDCRIYASPYR